MIFINLKRIVYNLIKILTQKLMEKEVTEKKDDSDHVEDPTSKAYD